MKANARGQLLHAVAMTLLLGSCTQQPNPPALTAEAAKATATEPARKAAPEPTYDGPFGLKGGMSLAQLREVVDLQSTDSSGIYTSETTPGAHPSFSGYLFFVSDNFGLCAVSGVGHDIETGSYGTEVKSEFEKLDAALQKKYGPRKKYDHVVGLMDDPQFWMLGLQSKDRTLAAFWDREHKSTLPTDVGGISLQASASDIRTANVTLNYQFSNFDDCQKEDAEARDKNL